ncbi:hypothetical protein IQ241_07025 [Romeria aff. gracilis LEGE 07310]|uniref:Ycf66 n=1 Tax=Vasconcelosia minhoensis LEGE 07310 TaxID=915328 RepID=A0A8J7AAB2_9CYAN|nr:Ycf66 family protein [Romeria gracilis]MBE9077051.1 hypothetical protein [Romeria aff. gracilis LEGE 07310]
MVNANLNFVSFLGIALALAGAALYFLRQFRPNLARDYDVFFSAVALGAGAIMLFNGWRYDPIMQFGQLLLASSAIFFAYESIRLRGIATEQAKRQTPLVDDDRPVSRVYRAEIDDWNRFDDRRDRSISGDRYGYDDDYRDEYRQSPPYDPRRRPAGRLKPSEDPRRPRPSEGQFDRGTGAPPGYWEDTPPRRPPSGSRPPVRPDRPSERSGRPADRPPRPTDRPLNVRPYNERPEQRDPSAPDDDYPSSPGPQ